jgi:hypothetical protein
MTVDAPPARSERRSEAALALGTAASVLLTVGGVLAALAGLFLLSLPLIFVGFACYVAGGSLWEQLRPPRAPRASRRAAVRAIP